MRSGRSSARYAAGAVIVVTAIAATACGSSPSSSPAPGASAATGASASAASGITNVTLGYVPYSDDASLFYAQDSGIFRQHGLNVTFIAQASPVAIEASMASGTEQFGFVTTPATM
jgi:NitT/TauT family transport system substrate-binding protein